MVRGDDGQHGHDDGNPQHMPPDADVIQQRHEANAEGVEQTVQEKDDGVDADDVRRIDWVAELEVEEGGDEEGPAKVDASGNRDLAQQVEPPGKPAPGGGIA